MEEKIHLNTIRTLVTVIARHSKAFKAFMETPNGEEYKELEQSREAMFKCGVICELTTFPNEVSPDMKESIELALKIKEYNESQEKLIAL